MTLLHSAEDDITCPCGNTPRSDGFYPCDADGNQMEPTDGGGWDGLYVCPVCHRLHRFEES